MTVASAATPAVVLTIAGSEATVVPVPRPTLGRSGSRAHLRHRHPDLRCFLGSQRQVEPPLCAGGPAGNHGPAGSDDGGLWSCAGHPYAASGEPARPVLDTVKIGRLGSPSLIGTVAVALEAGRYSNVVLDPVLICKGHEPGHARDTDQALKAQILQLATFVTPNHFEAELLSAW